MAVSNGTGQWSTRASLPVEIGEVGVAATRGKLYVVGGQVVVLSDDYQRTFREMMPSGLSWGSDTNLEYTPKTDGWRKRAPLPWETSHVALAELDGKLYAFGGFYTAVHQGAQTFAAEYDPAKDAWRSLPPLSSPRGSAGAAVVDGRIHVISGRGLDKKVIPNHEVFEPTTGNWTTAAPLPLARDHIGVLEHDGKIHVFGGRTGDSGTNTAHHHVYDPATDSWRAAAPLPQARSAGAAVAYKGLLIYAGGECKPFGKPGQTATFDDVAGYDPKSDKWLTLTPLPQGRHAFGGVVLDDIVYFAAGVLTCGGGATSDLQTFIF